LKKQSKTGSQTAVNIAKTAVLELDGKQHRLVYDFNAICAAESVAGCNLLHALENLGDLTGMQLRGLLYAAMKPFSADVTIEEVSVMIRLDAIGAITKSLAEAYALSVPGKTQ
jgi:hypothetical protein